MCVTGGGAGWAIALPDCGRIEGAAGTYEDKRTGPHHVFGIIKEKSGLYGCMLLQTGKVRNYQNTNQGNQLQLTY